VYRATWLRRSVRSGAKASLGYDAVEVVILLALAAFVMWERFGPYSC
jgi:hypothetical protein